MSDCTDLLSYTPFFPPSPVSKTTRNKTKELFSEEPQKPDWLMIFVTALFLLTLLLLWIVDIPNLLN